MPTGQAHAAAPAQEAEFAQFMVANDRLKARREFSAQLPEAFTRALTSGLIAYSDKGRVAGVIAIGNYKVRRTGAINKFIEQMILPERVMQPDEAAEDSDTQAEQRIGQVSVFVIVAARLFGGAGIMNIAQDGDAITASHAALSGDTRAGRGQDEAEGGAAVHFTFDVDDAMVLLEDAAGNGKAQAGAFGLGGEERIEQPVNIFRWDADAVVLDSHTQQGLIFLMLQAGDFGVGRDHGGGDVQPAAGFHGIQGIEEEVDESLLQMALIPVNQVWRGGK